MNRREKMNYLTLFKCNGDELAGFVVISVLATGFFELLFLPLILLGIEPISFSYFIIAGSIAGCAFMLSKKDREIQRWKDIARNLQK